MNRAFPAMILAACLVAAASSGNAQQWLQRSVTDGNVTTHTYMNPQSGEVAVGQSIVSGNTTYHSGPVQNGVSKTDGPVTTHTFTDRHSGEMTPGNRFKAGARPTTPARVSAGVHPRGGPDHPPVYGHPHRRRQRGNLHAQRQHHLHQQPGVLRPSHPGRGRDAITPSRRSPKNEPVTGHRRGFDPWGSCQAGRVGGQ